MDRIPRKLDWSWVLTSIAASGCDLLLNFDRRRIRVCPNQGCRWVFFDETRGRTRRWCNATPCGNLFKVRRYRDRKRAEEN
jgi:predicted RNA-binding Zn ribbon-like protein